MGDKATEDVTSDPLRGASVGVSVVPPVVEGGGMAVGCTVGEEVDVGASGVEDEVVGVKVVGRTTQENDGIGVDASVGAVGDKMVGLRVGLMVGRSVFGGSVGLGVGLRVGFLVGLRVGFLVGLAMGRSVGASVGDGGVVGCGSSITGQELPGSQMPQLELEMAHHGRELPIRVHLVYVMPL